MLFDSHAHLNDPAFDPDRGELMAGLAAKGIGFVMNAGCDLRSSRESVNMAAEHPWLYASVGSHPDAANEVSEAVIEQYRLLCQNEKVKAIGEIGLDYHYEDVPRQIQQKAFRMQMALAQQLDMPVIIHQRDAHDDGMRIVREFPGVTGVFHCYSGSPEMAQQLVKMGWYIGFTGVLTFKNARKTVETAASIPLDRIVIETDCPYMAPEPFRGRRNDPGYLHRMAEKLGQIRGITAEDAARITTENAKRLYKID